MDAVIAQTGVVEDVLVAYRDLVGVEARLAEKLGRQGVRIGASVADQWPLVHDFLQLYARGLARAGALVLAGSPDAGSRATGIPFTGPREARERLGLQIEGETSSPSARWWDAAAAAPPAALFSVAHLAHANPFDLAPMPAVRDAAATHLTRLLSLLRPQAVVTVGAEALAALGHALGQRDLVDLARAPEDAWLARWPPATPLLRHPLAEVAQRPPFRVRVVPVPALDGPNGHAAEASLRSLVAYLAG
ncbi:MAG: hypothetical protein QOE90_3445 [Thermoplasmata archaeon]|jgi:hypothetical protein|nr:hypothetical protein [Thermoplasmata archaeon]